MLVANFKSWARAGTPGYLLDVFPGKVICYVGAPHSFAHLLSVVRSKNPYYCGCVSWDAEIEPGLALDIARDYIYRLILAGADPTLIPHLLVVHREPFGSGWRTAVHFTVLNFHLGTGLKVRWYRHERDRYWIDQWRRGLNEEFGWGDPDHRRRQIHVPGLRVSPLCARPILRLVRTLAVGASPSDFLAGLQSLVNAEGGDKASPLFGSKIVEEGERICLELASGKSVCVGEPKSVWKKKAPLANPPYKSLENVPAWRKKLFISDYGDEFFVPGEMKWEDRLRLLSVDDPFKFSALEQARLDRAEKFLADRNMDKNDPNTLDVAPGI